MRFRLWAPAARAVILELLAPVARQLPMQRAGDGWFEATCETPAGSVYQYRIDGGGPFPDPASRMQASDADGPSVVVDPTAYEWRDSAWRGRPWSEAILYEVHVGSFVSDRPGTFAAVEEKLDHLATLGVTALQLMPVADFPGRWNWGYDGVLPFAPDRCYGTPDDLKSLVDAAHARGLMVLLDVVYNHFGPEACYLTGYALPFFNAGRTTPWGPALEFDRTRGIARDFFLENALYWLEEFHLDGLRLDAPQHLHDPSSTPHFLEELAAWVHAGPGRERPIHLILEQLPGDRDRLPQGYAACWNDPVHHALHAALTGESEGYYARFSAAPLTALGRALTSASLPLQAVVFLQNHDQVGNRALGERLVALAPAARLHAALAVLLLLPCVPLLFMGEEWGARTPFPFFCDFQPALAAAVAQGRRREFSAFAQFHGHMHDPADPGTFAGASLDWGLSETPEGRTWLALYRTLLGLRAEALWPRLGPRTAVESVALRADGLLEARFSLDPGRLSLLANLTDEPRPCGTRPQGRTLYASDGARQRPSDTVLAPWSVLWTLSG